MTREVRKLSHCPYSECILSTGTMLKTILKAKTILKINTDLAVQHVESSLNNATTNFYFDRAISCSRVL